MSRGLTASLLVCVAAAGVAIGALTLDAGGGDDGNGGDGGAASDATTPQGVVIDDFAFSGATVAPGQTVTVDNRDDAPHTVTAGDGSFDTGTIDAASPGSFVAPTTPGTYQFNCSIHPQMSGTLTVEAAEGGTGTEQNGGTGPAGESGGTPGY